MRWEAVRWEGVRWEGVRWERARWEWWERVSLNGTAPDRYYLSGSTCPLPQVLPVPGIR